MTGLLPVISGHVCDIGSRQRCASSQRSRSMQISDCPRALQNPVIHVSTQPCCCIALSSIRSASDSGTQNESTASSSASSKRPATYMDIDSVQQRLQFR